MVSPVTSASATAGLLPDLDLAFHPITIVMREKPKVLLYNSPERPIIAGFFGSSLQQFLMFLFGHCMEAVKSTGTPYYIVHSQIK